MPKTLALCLALAVSGLQVSRAGAGEHHGQRLPFPEILRPKPPLLLPQGFALEQQLPVPAAPGHAPINLPRDVPGRLAQCWVAPGAHQGKRLSATIRLSFKVDGSVLGAPVFTFVDAPPGSALRADVTRSIGDAIAACSPLPFTAALGSAIAGRPMTIHFVATPKLDTKETPT